MNTSKRTLILTMVLAAVTVLSACSPKQIDASSSAAEASLSASAGDATSSAAEESVPSLSAFTSTDLEGNEVTQEIFADYDLTMINIWATFCGPCLSEMPELGELAAEYKDKNVQIVGIVMDVLKQDGTISEEMVDTAKEVVAKTGAAYTHLLPSNDLIQAKLKDVTGVPETIFVDKSGNIVGKSYLGAKQKADWAKIIDKTLEDVK
ncbi:TlpA disulfide reductase family protein [Hydrogenoanaerobacterium sp.]|uniref:TlpA family protein disulfide reductase n=1 Tax=Hydrogenoanaerobacterium sp. TaxID=2953763 RepID=UPI002899D6F2|nr:TlpA disulfide reductase family protein [Hydrogenoanaerobacterium sp.]